MSTTSKYLRIARRALWYSLAALVVIVAVLVSLLRLFLPDLTAYRDDLEQLASTFLDHTVKIESMDARLVGFTPTLIFDDVYMLDKSGERELVRFKQARVGLALIESVRRRQVVPRDFVIDGIQLAITRLQDGRFLLQGVDVANLEKTFQTERPRGSEELSDWLFKRSRLSLRNSTILWKDLKQGGNILRFDDVNLMLRNNNQRHQLNGQVKLPERMGKRFDIAMDVEGDILNPREMKGKIYLRGDAVQLDKWGVKPEYMGVSLNSGIADFQLWGDWENNAIQQLSGDLTAYNLDLSLPVMDEPYRIRLLGGLFDVDRHEAGWTLKVDRFQYMSAGAIWPQTRFTIQHLAAGQQQAGEWRVDTDYFRIEDVASLLLQTTLPDAEQRELLDTMQPSGDVQGLHLRYRQGQEQPPDYQLQASFSRLSGQPWRSVPGVSGLAGRVHADSQRGRVTLESADATLAAPRLFREPLRFNRVQAALQWRDENQAWRIWSEQLRLDTEHVELDTDLLLSVPRAAPRSAYLDLQSRFQNGKLEFARRYYPTGIMGPKLVEWLDSSIVSGHLGEGGVVFNGRLKDFPFGNNRGQFKVAFDARDVLLDYRQGWPAVDGIDLSAVFTGQGMTILTRQGRLFNTRLSPSRASIADFKHPQLQLQVDANGRLADVARFLVESPAAPGGRRFVQRSRIEGKAHTRFEAMIPLSRRMQARSPTRYQGRVNLADGQLHLLDERLTLGAINGQIAFDQDGVSSRELRSELLGEAVELELDTRPAAEGGKQISVLANGRLDAPRLVTRFAPRWADSVAGSTTWHGALVLETGKSARAPLLRIDSTLEGVELDLPPPLNKPAQEVTRLLSEVWFEDETRSSVSVDLGDRLATRFQLAHSARRTRLDRGGLHFGPGTVQLPADQSLLITGILDAVNPADWQRVYRARQRSGAQGVPLQLPIRVAMQRLALIKSPQPETAPDQPVRPDSYAPPPALPRIRGQIQQLHYAGHALGRLEFDLRSLQKGLRLQRLLLEGENMRLHASGDWLHESGRHASNLNYELTSPSMGRLLDSLGFSAIIEGGVMQSRGDLHWNAPPAAFELGMLSGNMSLLVENGSLVRVKPGAGRLLGLFSLSALPRRLMLDFSDTFREGFSFDRMEGQFRLQAGNAYSDPLKIQSPAAEISIQGRTGLAQQDFDQRVTVTPMVGDTLPVAGGLLFGTQIGAAILFLEKLLGGGIDKASAKRYQITGSWEDPQITPLDESE